jgi:hypothetical protein
MHTALRSLATTLLLAGCDNSGVVELKGSSSTTTSDDTAASELTLDVDSDGDGAVDDDDCRPSAPEVHPGAVEVCDGVDNDCDGLVDQDDDSLDLSTRVEAWTDADGDGYGDAAAEPEWVCEPDFDQSTRPLDCDDTDASLSPASVSPGATEVCENGLDDDCDGESEECRVAYTLQAWTDPDE